MTPQDVPLVPLSATPGSFLLKAAYGATIFLSAFLLFQVQPIIGKMILPWYGGSASVWTTCLLFFQSMLLLGYLYTHFLISAIPHRAQSYLHIALLLLAMVSLPITPSAAWKPSGNSDPSIHLLGVLGLSVGLPYFVLSTTGPLVQVWFARESPGVLPYRLFALSNLGSMIGLLGYPFAIEPVSSASAQSTVWSTGFTGFATLCAFLAWRATKRAVASRPADARPVAPSSTKPITLATWLLLAACPSLLLVSLTSHLTRDVAPIPLLWVVPLAVYLLSFIISFDHRRWYKRAVFIPLFVAAAALFAYLAAADNEVLSINLGVFAYLLAFFVFAMVCHGELVRLAPPANQITVFYLVVAAGGTLGGLFVAVIAPQVFSADYEFPIGVVLTTVVAFLVWGSDPALAERRRAARLRTIILLAGLGVAASSGFVFAKVEFDKLHDTLLASRNFYGSLRVDREGVAEDSTLSLMHGVIVHGSQFAAADRRRSPTTYYGESSGIGLTLSYFRKQHGALRVGVIGLGAGTLACYGRGGDRYRFYEINPTVVNIAQSYFSYLHDTPAEVDMVTGDARISLEREPAQHFDVLVVDAFSGDSIPMHLLTREAMREYFRHLSPTGVLAIHASNQYLNLAPVVRLAAESFGKKALIVSNDEDEDKGVEASDWILVTTNQRFLEAATIKEASATIKVPPGAQAWTDDFSSVVPILQ